MRKALNRKIILPMAGAFFGAVVATLATLSFASVDPEADRTDKLVVDDENGFEIIDRKVVDYSVPVFRTGEKYGNHRPTAVDIMPRGAPDDEGANGVAWQDICNADLLANRKANVECLRSGIDKAGNIYIGSKAFNGGTGKDIYLLHNGQVKGVIRSDGLEVFGKVKATSFEDAALPPAARKN